MDIELAIDMLEMAPHLDHVILFSGDGDFRRLVEVVQRKSVRVSVVSTVKSNPPMIADELHTGKQMISSNCRTSRKKSAAPINRALKAQKTTASTTIFTRNTTTIRSSKPCSGE